MGTRWVISLCAGVAVLTCAIAWRSAVSSEPQFAEKELSWWLDDLANRGPTRGANGTNQITAIRAIGTNAIPWLLREYRQSTGKGAVLAKKLNNLLGKQNLFSFRLRDPDYHIYRATVGFRALGEIAQPAIPELLSMLEANPRLVLDALVSIGRPAVPAVLHCLTNTRPYNNQLPLEGDVPQTAISALFDAAINGELSEADTAVFIPEIEAWEDQTTNQPVQAKAKYFLDNYQAGPFK